MRMRILTAGRLDLAAAVAKSAGLAMLLSALALAWAVSASTPVRGETGKPSVEVDLGALDALGPVKPVPESERIVLRPPKALTGAAPTSDTSATATPSGQATESAAATAVPKAPPSAATDRPVRLVFAKDSAALPQDAEQKLAPLAARMKRDRDLRVELLGYAPGEGTAAREARRLSLSRALAVRLYLTQQGIGGTRAMVRPLGSETKEQPIDRVDVVVMK
ncbi:MAG: OmpA family protein [Alphaproteobacteria bacterium]|nr:OmpA family protein [Alphaproteobacteria bacterium]